MAGKNDEIRILIQGALDEALTKKEIDSQLEEISKKIDKLNIKIGISDETIKNLTELSKASERLKNIINDQNRVVRESVREFVDADGTIKRVIEQEKASGEIFTRTTEKIRNQERAVENLINNYERLGNVQQRTFKVDNEGNQRLTQEVRQTEDLNKQILRFNEQGQVTSNIIKDNIGLREKEAKKIQEQNEKLAHQLELYKRTAQINAQNLRRRFGSDIDENALRKWLDDVNKLNMETPNLQRKMKDLAVSFKEIEANAKTSSSHVVGFGEQLSIALKRVPIWMAAMTAFYAPLRGLRNAVQNIIEIDTQMTELARVLPAQVELGDVLQTNIELANQLGKSIQDINEAAIGFARQGFDEDQIKYLTEAAILAANVSELTVEESMSAMTAAMSIFNIEAENSLRIVDALNEVDNNFAITTKDLALAIQKAGSTAQAFGRLNAA